MAVSCLTLPLTRFDWKQCHFALLVVWEQLRWCRRFPTSIQGKLLLLAVWQYLDWHRHLPKSTPTDVPCSACSMRAFTPTLCPRDLLKKKTWALPQTWVSANIDLSECKCNRCPHLLQLPAFLTGYVWCEARFLLLCFPWNAYAGHTTYTQHITHNTQTTCTTHTHHTWHAQHIYTLQNAVVQVVNGITWF